MVPDGLLGDGVSTRQSGRVARDAAYLPGGPSGLVVGILVLHRGVYLPNCQALPRAAEDRASEDDGERMLRPAIGVLEARKRVGAAGVRVVHLGLQVVI